VGRRYLDDTPTGLRAAHTSPPTGATGELQISDNRILESRLSDRQLWPTARSARRATPQSTTDRGGPPRRRALARSLLFRGDVDSSTFEPHVARALELQVGKARVVVAVDQVDRIVETVCTPMPMAHRLVRGIGFDDRRPIVCVVLSGKSAEPASEMITAVLLTGQGPVVWALCADRVLGVVTLVERSTATDARWPRWLGRVRSQDGRTLAKLDGAQMVLDIGGAP
jgi:hypothetical protein